MKRERAVGRENSSPKAGDPIERRERRRRDEGFFGRGTAWNQAAESSQGRKSLAIMPGYPMQRKAVRRDSRDFAVRGSWITENGQGFTDPGGARQIRCSFAVRGPGAGFPNTARLPESHPEYHVLQPASLRNHSPARRCPPCGIKPSLRQNAWMTASVDERPPFRTFSVTHHLSGPHVVWRELGPRRRAKGVTRSCQPRSATGLTGRRSRLRDTFSCSEAAL
jgi:hypothetical protein